MQLREKLTTDFEYLVRDHLDRDEEILYSVRSDLTLDRVFGASWLVVASSHLFVLDDCKIVLTLKVDEIKEVVVDELFGGSRLVATSSDGERTVLIYYTKAMVPEFGTLCRMINQLIRKETPKPPAEGERCYCPRCNAPLPERGSTCPLCVPRWTVFRRLLGLLRPFRVRALLLMCATTLVVTAQMIPPYITKRIVDDVIRGGKHDQLPVLISIMFGAGLLFLIARFSAGLMSSWLAARLAADLRSQLHNTLQRLQLSYFQKRGSGELVGRVMHDTEELQHFMIDGMPYLLVNTVSIVAIAVILLRLDTQLALLVFLPVPFLIFGANWFWRRLDPLFHKRGSKISALHSILNESINGIRVIKAFAQENRRTEEFDRQNRTLFRVRYNIDGTFIGFQEVMFWIMQVGVTCVWFFAAYRISRNDPTITLGDLLAFVGYIWLLYGPLQWFTAVLNWMTHAFSGAERIFGVLDTTPEVYDAPQAVALPKVSGAVSFRDVHFSYERGKETIKGVSFDVAPGEMVGLVGKSGAGKSTVINLICRFFDADSGTVMIDGHDIRDVRLSQLRGQIGMVLQETFLFSGSILDNIRYGKPDASFEDVTRAAKAAYAHDFILDKEDGYDTKIGDQGSSLSGGERQRISIARAILHDPPILILDEATSSVDSETEQHIQEAIGRLIKGRTTIAIAHRLATLRNADRLIVLEDGKLTEMGTHDELMARNGVFAKLVNIQTELNKIRGQIWEG